MHTLCFQIVALDDGRVQPKHVVEREEGNKLIALWTEV
jgi:hypothetical protein